MASQAARFQLFIKAGKDGFCAGDCPFSHRAVMFAQAVIPKQVEVTAVNTINKPDWFLELNPEGKVPVLIDRQDGNKIIPDSGEIVKYLHNVSPNPALQTGYGGPGVEASSGIFPKFAAMMKNKERSKDGDVAEALTKELEKLNTFLEKQRETGHEYMLCGSLCELDFQVLPKLRHIQVAGRHFKKFEIPQELSALKQYIRCSENNPIFKATCPPDDEIIWGWSKFFT